MDDVAFVDVYIEFGVWFQSIFYLNIYYNKFFLIFFFYISTSKWFENTKNILIWSY